MRTKEPKKTKPFFVGLDLSMTRPGICMDNVRDGFYCVAYANPDKDRYIHRIARFHGIVKILIHKMKPALRTPSNTIIMMEDYAFGASGKTFEIGEMSGILKWRLFYECGIRPENLLLCSNTHLKMFACNKGNAAKELIIKECYKKWRFDTDDNNEADAFVLWKIVRSLNNPKGITKYQKDVIERIRKYNQKK